MSAQTDQPQADTPTPVLKMPALAGHRWTKQIVGAVVEIGAEDLLGESKFRVTEATVDNFGFDMLEGGSVALSLRVKCKPDPEDVGMLYERLRQTVLVTITPPEHATYEPAPAQDADDAQRRLDDGEGDDDADPQDDGDDHDGPRTSDDLPASAVAADGEAPASTVPVTRRRRRKVEPVFPGALDGTGDRDPFGDGPGTMQ